MSNRGQAHTLEGFAAALLLVASVVFALQVTAVTPLTASTSSQHIENQQAGVARGLLASAVHNESLEPALLSWNESGGTFHDATADGYYALGGPKGLTFGRMLNRTFRDRGIAVNVNIQYLSADRNRRTVRLVYMGVPSDNSVTVTRMVTLQDDDVLYNAEGDPTDTTLTGATGFYAPDAAPDSPVYNVLSVEVVTWRM